MSELSYIRRKYDSQGNYLRSETYDPLRFIQRPTVSEGPFWIDNSQRMGFAPAYKKQTLEASYSSEQILPDGDFPLEGFLSAGELSRWEGEAPLLQKPLSPKESAGSQSKNNYGIYLGIPSGEVSLARYIESTPVYVEEDFNVSFRLSLAFQVNLPSLAQNTPPAIYIRVQCGNYFLTDQATWIREQSLIDISVSQFYTPGKFSITPEIIRESGPLQVRIYELISSAATASPEKALLLDYIHADLVYNGQDMPQSLSFEIKNELRCTYTPDTIELFHADVPDYKNARLAFKNAVMLKNGTDPDGVQLYDVTRKWYRLGELEEKPIQQILLEQIMRFSGVPRQRLTGRMRARSLPLHLILQDPSNRPRLFMVGYTSYHTGDSTYDLELLELDKTLPEVEALMKEYTKQEHNSLEYN